MRAATIVLGCLLVVWLLPLASPAAEPSAEALVTEASDLYANLDFEEALTRLNAALVVKGNKRNLLVRIYHLRGLCLGSLGRYPEARGSFARLLALEPSFRLGSDVSPRIQAPFQELVKSNPPRFDARLLPPPGAVLGQPLVFGIQLQDSVPMAHRAKLYYRRGQAQVYASTTTAVRGEGEYRLSLPAALWQGPGSTPAAGTGKPAAAEQLAWFAVIEDENEGELKRFGDELHPLALDITERRPAAAGALAEASPWYSKWWVWAIVGGVAVGATATALALTLDSGSDGPFDFTVDFQ